MSVNNSQGKHRIVLHQGQVDIYEFWEFNHLTPNDQYSGRTAPLTSKRCILYTKHTEPLIHNSTPSHWSTTAHLATAPQHIPTQHDMLPQHLVCKYELNCEYCNMTLARNKAPWWWSVKIETCRSVLKCFKNVLCEIICVFVGWWNEVILQKNALCYNKIYTLTSNYTDIFCIIFTVMITTYLCKKCHTSLKLSTRVNC